MLKVVGVETNLLFVAGNTTISYSDAAVHVPECSSSQKHPFEVIFSQGDHHLSSFLVSFLGYCKGVAAVGFFLQELVDESPSVEGLRKTKVG